MDNGFLRLDHVRVPREQMLMRYSQVGVDNAQQVQAVQVSPEGRYTRIGHDKIGYGTMLFVRSVLVRGQGQQLAQAATNPIRYSCVRRQGEIESGSVDDQLGPDCQAVQGGRGEATRLSDTAA